MKLSFEQIEVVFKTLPVGYYLNRDITHELSATSQDSYYAPEKDLIVVSAPTIQRVAEQIDETVYTFELEELIRSLLYHEISHVILTPKSLFNFCSSNKEKDIMNVFEDEKIETTLRDYYYGVNFKKSIILINNYQGEDPVGAFNEFYWLVRFHKGPKKYLDKVKNIIIQYMDIKLADDYTVMSYVQAVLDLYKEYTKDVEQQKKNQNNKNNQNQNGQGQNDQNNQNGGNSANDNNTQDQQDSNGNNNQNGDSQNNQNDQDDNNGNGTNNTITDTDKNNQDNSGTSGDNSNDDTDNNQNGNAKSSTKDKDNTSKDSSKPTKAAGTEAGDPNKQIDENVDDTEPDNLLTDDQVKKMIEDFDINTNLLNRDRIKELIAKVINAYYNKTYTDKLKFIVDLKLRKDKRQGNAINSYSGRFIPKAVIREDYKWWSQQNRLGHLNQYNKVHFNLYIDNSWSFKNNDVKVNMLLNALNSIVSRDFTFDVITINDSIYEWPDTKRLFVSDGGTCLHYKIKDVIQRHLKRNTTNYNIVLFDGECSIIKKNNSDPNPFTYFDIENTIIIWDSTNTKHLAKPNKAKVFTTNTYYKTFVEKLFEMLEKAI